MLQRRLLIILSFLMVFSFSGQSAHADEDNGISSLRQTSKAFAAVAKQVSPSVVYIQVESVRQGGPLSPFQSPFGDDLFKRFFGDRLPSYPNQGESQPEQRVTGQGSGFVFKTEKGLVSGTSYILTNNHVVEGAEKIRVTFQDGREYDAKITGADPKSDVAVLEIKESEHPALIMGNSGQLEVGEWVIAVGNPFGLSHTLTVGVVSAKGRSGLGINDYEDFIQTDAAINPGNSGGPLLNLDGEVVGINTAIFSRSGGYMGVGFAIPVDLAKNIADQLIESGEVTRGYLGIVIQDLTPDLAESFGIKEAKGILVAQVYKGSPAEQAGIETGDLIIRFQGEKVTEVADFRNRVALTPPGNEASLIVIRDGERKTINVKIGDLDDGQILSGSSIQTTNELGLTVQDLTPELARQFDVRPDEGVVVTEVQPNSVAAMASIQPGSVILQVDKKAVNSVSEFQSAVKKSSDDKRVLLLVSDRGMTRYLVLNWN